MTTMKELLQEKCAHGEAQSCGLPDGRDGPERAPELPDRGLVKRGSILALPALPWFTEGHDTSDRRAARELMKALRAFKGNTHRIASVPGQVGAGTVRRNDPPRAELRAGTPED